MIELTAEYQRLAEEVRTGARRAVARAISIVENDQPVGPALLSGLFPATGQAHRIGITGPPGAGKSTLTNKLAKQYRAAGLRVGVIAVDPTSPFTGGALLGDRVRMTDVELDDGVFIRSMASRGSLGGLSRKASEAADVLDAAGCNVILMETVGVGQSELDIARAADTTVVVLVPESGDGIQAMKAGLMEIADVFVLNKSDRPGADQAVMSIKLILGFRPHDEHSWIVDILKAQANEGAGIDTVLARIQAHREWLTSSGQLAERRRQRVRNRIREIIDARLRVSFWSESRLQILDRATGEILSRSVTPYQVAEHLIADFQSR